MSVSECVKLKNFARKQNFSPRKWRKSRFRELPTDEINKMLEKKIISVAITTATNFGLNSFNGTYNISEVFL